jgi:hypothetical protein
MMASGGDFAGGVIALQGRRLGGQTFSTFHKKAAALIKASGSRLYSRRGQLIGCIISSPLP